MKPALLMFTVVALVLPAQAQENNCGNLFPLPGVPEAACQYVHEPYATFVYNGYIRATWAAQIELLEAYILADWEVVRQYVPGEQVQLPIDTTKTRYDFAYRYRIIATGEIRKGLTPIWCITSQSLPAPLDGCFSSIQPNASTCETTQSTTCPNGGIASVTCEGDAGTCNGSCEEGKGCSCTSSTTTKQLIGSTLQTTTKIVKKETPCPPPPPPPPDPPPDPPPPTP